jgi:hypothetical protein
MTSGRTARFVALVLIAAIAVAWWLVLRAAAPLPAAPTTPVNYAPTVAPTEAAMATAEPVTPAAFYATQQAGVQATSFARATAEPFPTAGPAEIQTGQPSSASASRGGLTLRVHLPKDTYFSGEAGQADISLSNAGPDTVVMCCGPGVAGLTFLDAQGHWPPPWPWQPSNFVGGPPYIQTLAPGQSITTTQVFYVGGAASSYALWVDTRFSRASLSNPGSEDGISLRLEAGPIPLQVLEPATGRQLHAELRADHAGWSLRITDAAGNVPFGPFTGVIEAASADSLTGGPLGPDSNGVWSQSWDNPNFDLGPIDVRVWVGAPGYIAAIAKVTVAGAGDAGQWFDPIIIPVPQTFATLLSAQSTLGIPLYRLGAAQSAADFDSIQAAVYTDTNSRAIDVHQLYVLPGGAWLDLDQYHTDPPNDGNWGEARYDVEAQVLTLAGQPAYLISRWGWWRLDWKIGIDAFELRAPVGAIAPADLVALAGGVRR